MKQLLQRRVFALLLTVVVTIGSFSIGILGESFVLGNINADQTIDASDALLGLQYSVDLVALSEEEFDAADVDANKAVDASDALCILQYSVGLIDQFPAEDPLIDRKNRIAAIGKDSPVPFSLVYCDDLDYESSVDGVDAPDLFNEYSASLLISNADEMKTRFADAESSILSAYAAICDDAFFEEHAVFVFWQYLPSIDFHAAVNYLELEEDTLIVDYTQRHDGPSDYFVEQIGYCFVVMEIDAQIASSISEIIPQSHYERSTEVYDDVWAVGMDDYLS